MNNKLHSKSCYLLIIYMKTDEILAARTLFVICTRVTTLSLYSCYMKNTLVFSQSDVRNRSTSHAYNCTV